MSNYDDNQQPKQQPKRKSPWSFDAFADMDGMKGMKDSDRRAPASDLGDSRECFLPQTDSTKKLFRDIPTPSEGVIYRTTLCLFNVNEKKVTETLRVVVDALSCRSEFDFLNNAEIVYLASRFTALMTEALVLRNNVHLKTTEMEEALEVIDTISYISKLLFDDKLRRMKGETDKEGKEGKE